MYRVATIFILFCFLAFGQIASAREVVISTFERPSRIVSTVEIIIKEAYRRLGHQLQVVKLPGERSLLFASTGEVDGDLFRVGKIDREYKNLIKVPVNLLTLEVVVFTRDRVFPVTGWNSLIPYTVGYRRGVKAVEYHLNEQIKTISAATYVPVFRMLEAGRCDVVVSSRASGNEAIDVLSLKGISALDPPLIKESMYHYLHVKNKDLIAPLTKVLTQMEREGLLNPAKLSPRL
jgi:polar amino acid transport system substrate-binding protein